MPMVPDLAANMPSRTDDTNSLLRSFEESYVWDNFLDDSDKLLHTMSATDLLGPLDPLINDGLFDDAFLMDENKRECLLGKTDEDCLRECGSECDPFIDRIVARRWGTGSNMAIAPNNSAEELMMVNPQSVLPQHQYSPYSDHCYYQTIGYPDSKIQQPSNSYESESQTDESADEIVDVETVQEKVEPPPTKVLKKRGRKPGQKLKLANSKAVTFNKRTAATKRNRIIQQGRVTKRQKRGRSFYEPSSTSSSDAEGNGRRSNHNDMERHRRDEQKRQLQHLRLLVPLLKNNTKAPKVMILTEAANHCNQLTLQEKQCINMKIAQTKKNAELKRRLAHLQNLHKVQ